MRLYGNRRSAGAAAARARRGASLLVVSALSAAVAGCGSVSPFAPGPATTGSIAAGPATSIAFESMDGAPADVRARLEHDLAEEAALRHIAVAPAGTAAAYRIRGYLAAHPEHGRTVIAWSWDIYDSGLQRAFRLGGEEHAAGAKAWADDAMLRRLARAGLDQLAAFLAAPPAPPEASPPPAGRGVPGVAGLGGTALADAGHLR